MSYSRTHTSSTLQAVPPHAVLPSVVIRLPTFRSALLSRGFTTADLGEDDLGALDRVFKWLLLRPLTAAAEAGELRQHQVGGFVSTVANLERKALDELQDMSQGGITPLIPIRKTGPETRRAGYS